MITQLCLSDNTVIPMSLSTNNGTLSKVNNTFFVTCHFCIVSSNLNLFQLVGDKSFITFHVGDNSFITVLVGDKSFITVLVGDKSFIKFLSVTTPL